MNRTCLAPFAIALTLLTACSSPEQKKARYLAKGREMMDRHDYARALLEFRNASRIAPKDAEPWYRIGLAALATGNIQEAATSFRRATDLNPKHNEAQLRLAGLMAATRKKDLVEDAEKRLQAVLAATPDSADAAATLALSEAQLGKAEQATTRLEDVLKKHPAHLQSAITLVRLRLAKKDVDGAEAILRKAVESGPKSVEAATVLARFYLARGKNDLADAEVRRALTLDGRNSAALLTLAAVQTRANKLDEAEATYQRIAGLEDKELKPLYAAFLYRRGKRDAALTELRRLAAAYPLERSYRTRLVTAYALLNRMPEGEAVLTKALKDNPRDADALLQRAQLYVALGKLREAETDVRQLLSFNPQSAEGHMTLAAVYRSEGSPNERRELADALRLRPDLLPARISMSRALIAANDAAGAVAILDQAPPSQTNLGAVILQRNWALLAARNVPEARAGVNRLLTAGRLPEIVLQDGLVKLAEKQYSAALAAAEEILAKQPGNLQAAALIADVYAAEKQPRKAMERIGRLAQDQPKSVEIQMLLGRVAVFGGDRAQARAAFEAAKAAAPQSSLADLALAELDFSEGRYPEAKQKLALVTAAEPRNTRALLLGAHSELRAGSTREAIAKYRSVLAADPTNLIALNNLAYLIAGDDPDEALKLGEQALSVAPDYPPVHDTLGYVYYRKGMYRRAVEYLKTAVAKEPTPARQYHLGMSYVKAGEMNTGSDLITVAVKRDPNLPKTEQGW